MFLFICCVSLFQDVMGALEATILGTIGFTALGFLATLRARWKGKDRLGESQSMR